MSMWNLDGWEQITCAERETPRYRREDMTVWSTLSDPEGLYGERMFFTEWGTADAPVVRDYRYLDPTRPCEHYGKVTP